MNGRTFICHYENCHRLAHTVPLAVADTCRHETCAGRKLLLAPPLLPARPFWKNERFLAALVLLMAAGFVLALLIHAALPKQAEAPPPARESGVAPQDPRFEVQSLIASSENLLRLWRAKLVAQDTAQTKWVNGQRVTSNGRTTDETSDRIKLTYQEQRRFADIVQQKEKDILAESSRYQQIIQRVTAFPPRTIAEIFNSIRLGNTDSARGELALGLAERHALGQRQGHLELKAVYSDFENAALR